MKKRCIAVILLWVIIACFGLHIRSIAYADPFTASQIGSLGYAMMESWGIGFNAGNATAAGMNDFMTSQVEDYVNYHGGSIADLFIGQIAVDAMGKLVVSYQMYNSIISFVDWLSDKFNLTDTLSEMTYGLFDGKYLPTGMLDASIDINPTGISVLFNTPVTTQHGSGFQFVTCYNNGNQIYSNSAYPGFYYGGWSLGQNGNWVGIFLPGVNGNGGTFNAFILTGPRVTELNQQLSWDGTNYVEPTILNPGKEWVGDIDGYSQPDTNLDQLLSGIDQAVADNNLDVDGEVIDIPVPPGPVPTWTPVDDVIDGINQMGEQLDGLGNDIGDISGHLDDIGDQIDGIEDSLEGVQEGIESQTGVISGAIDQATSDVVDAIGEQTAALDQTLTETAEGVQDIAEALQPGEIEPKKFDLRGLFPFCIPFDIHNLLLKFQAAPVAPHVQLPFVIQSIGFSYTFDLDFSVFDPVAQIMRTVEFIVFAIGLAWATSKVIKW